MVKTHPPAIISDDGLYRYWLARWIDDLTGSQKLITFVMLNPSTADATQDDPTIRRCRGFSRREGAGGFIVVNLYAWRATNPNELRTAQDAIGDENVRYVRAAIDSADVVIAAWGAKWQDLALPRLDIEQWCREQDTPLMCLGVTRDGHPRHPLYVKGDQPLIPYPPEETR